VLNYTVIIQRLNR